MVVPIWITSTSTPWRLFITDSLAEQVSGPVSTKTRGRFSVGRLLPNGVVKPCASEWNGNGESAAPVGVEQEGA